MWPVPCLKWPTSARKIDYLFKVKTGSREDKEEKRRDKHKDRQGDNQKVGQVLKNIPEASPEKTEIACKPTRSLC